jgi:hypothetical protein
MAFTRNTGRVAENMKITLADGTTAWVRVMPRNKGVTLPEGASIDPRWHVQHGQNVKHFTSGSPEWSTKADAATKAQILGAKGSTTGATTAATETAATVAATTEASTLTTTTETSPSETAAVASTTPTTGA